MFLVFIFLYGCKNFVRADQSRIIVVNSPVCEQEGVRYRDYRLWRNSMGIAPRIWRSQTAATDGMEEVADRSPQYGHRDYTGTYVRQAGAKLLNHKISRFFCAMQAPSIQA